MYERKSKDSLLKKIGILTVSVTVLLGMSLILIFSAIQALAAPEDPEIEEKAVNMGLTAPPTATPKVSAAIPEETPKSPLIVLDPGHGGIDFGCQNGEILEKDINLQIAELAEEKLLEKGYRVLLIREEDVYIAKEERVELANELQADVYVSIHQNSYEGQEAAGIETWYDGSKGREDQRLAKLLHYETVRATGAEERELVDSNELHVTSKTQMPSCLIETGFLSNNAEKELLVNEAYQEKISDGIVSGIDLFFRPKTMYLTFDDGPSAENTEKILDILKEKEIQATFFMIGEYVEKYPEVAKRVAEEGHTIGIHCYRHDYQVLYESVDSYLEDFQKAYDVVKEVTGVEPVFFRFPGGSVNAYNKEVSADIVEAMEEKGFIYFDWNASLEDAVSKAEPKELIINARETTLGRKKVVMLAHDTVDNTVLCLPELIDQFPDYTIKPLKTWVRPIQFPQPKEKE